MSGDKRPDFDPGMEWEAGPWGRRLVVELRDVEATLQLTVAGGDGLWAWSAEITHVAVGRHPAARSGEDVKVAQRMFGQTLSETDARAKAVGAAMQLHNRLRGMQHVAELEAAEGRPTCPACRDDGSLCTVCGRGDADNDAR